MDRTERLLRASRSAVRPQQDQDLSLQAPQCDPAADGNYCSPSPPWPNRGHRGGHLQDPPGSTIDAYLTGRAEGYTLINYIDLFTSKLAVTNLWTPLLNTLLLAVGTCVVSILFGGLFAFLVTRTDMAWRKYLQRHLHFPLHHAPVDPGRGVAAPVQLQRRHRDG